MAVVIDELAVELTAPAAPAAAPQAAPNEAPAPLLQQALATWLVLLDERRTRLTDD